MSENPLTQAQKNKIESYLSGYNMNRKLLRLERYKKDFFSNDPLPYDEVMPDEAPLARARMFEVRHFILSLGNCDEKLFLYYHYIKDDSVERCAELLGISVRTAYRLKARALAMAFFEKSKQDMAQ